MSYYVKIKHRTDVLGMVASVAIPTGKVDGAYAQFLCIDPQCIEQEVWATKEQLEKVI